MPDVEITTTNGENVDVTFMHQRRTIRLTVSETQQQAVADLDTASVIALIAALELFLNLMRAPQPMQ